MKKSIKRVISLITLSICITTFVGCSSSNSTAGTPAKTSSSEPAKTDSPTSSKVETKLPVTLGKPPAGPRPEGPTEYDLPYEPKKLFDNVYYVGYTGTGSLIINTSEGLILLDTQWKYDDAKDIIIPGMKKLGLDPAKLKYVFLSHGHVDHIGSAKYFEETFNIPIFITKADWELMNDPTAKPMKDPWGNMSDKLPKPTKYTEFNKDGQKITLGDTTITVIPTPGHTPGSVSFIIPVKDNGITHMAGVWGGAGVPSTLETNQQYLKSLDYFQKACDDANVDVEINTHPWRNDLYNKMQKMGERKAGEPNSLIIGKDGVHKYFDWLRQEINDKIATLKK